MRLLSVNGTQYLCSFGVKHVAFSMCCARDRGCHGLCFGARSAADEWFGCITSTSKRQLPARHCERARHSALSSVMKESAPLCIQYATLDCNMRSGVTQRKGFGCKQKGFHATFLEFEVVPPPCCSKSTPSRAHLEPAEYCVNYPTTLLGL